MAGEEDQRGYAKIYGRRTLEKPQTYGSETRDEDFDELITALPARLGRGGGAEPQGEKGEEGCFVNLGTMKSLSRHHATIKWDFIQGAYRIDCLSKDRSFEACSASGHAFTSQPLIQARTVWWWTSDITRSRSTPS
jgi:hypothetical protein